MDRKPNLKKVAELARDLRKEEPRPAHEQLGGYEMAARCLDKCRATLLGWQGDYLYGCPMDRGFLDAAGLDVKEFKELVATGASDEEVGKWIAANSRSR